jgi:hypothetical protein
LGYQAYDRTFGAFSVAGDVANGGTATPFGSVAPLTPEERQAVPGDVWNALIAGVQAQFAKPFWGILVPADPQDAAPPAAVQAAAPVLPAAAATPAVVEPAALAPVAPVAEPEPKSAPEPEAAPQVEVSEPEPVVTALEEAAADEAEPADPELAELGAALDDQAPAEAPATTSRATRGGGEPSQRRGAATDSDDSDGSAASSDRDADS